jgi:purine-binding chemotaxis protein CheW
MDFLSIRKKARERAEAKGAAAAEPAPAAAARAPEPEERGSSATPGEPAVPATAAPAPKERRRRRDDEAVLTEADVAEGALQARMQELAPTADGRFATWRPGAGPPPVEPDPLVYAAPVEPRRARHEPLPEQVPERSPELRGPPAPERPDPPRENEPADPLDAFFYRPDEEAGDVPLLGGGSGEEPAPAPAVAIDEYLTFEVGEEEFAIPIDHAREVMRAPGITEVPRAPAHVLGVVTVRGEVVAVLDIRSRLGLGKGTGSGARIMIVDAGEGPLGLLVDEVAGVVRLPRGAIEPCPQGIQAAAADCVTGIGRHRDRLFMVVDVAALLGREPQAEER